MHICHYVYRKEHITDIDIEKSRHKTIWKYKSLLVHMWSDGFFCQICFLACNSSFSPIAINRMILYPMTSSNLAYLFQWFEQNVFSMACFIICEVHLGLQSDLNLCWSESILIWIYPKTLTDALHSSGNMFYGLQLQLL